MTVAAVFYRFLPLVFVEVDMHAKWQAKCHTIKAGNKPPQVTKLYLLPAMYLV